MLMIEVRYLVKSSSTSTLGKAVGTLNGVYCGNLIGYCRQGCVWAGKDSNGVLGSNYMYGAYLGYSL